MAVLLTGANMPVMANFVSYLKFSQTQWFDTGVKGGNKIRVVVDCQAGSLDSGGTFPFGARTSYSSAAFSAAVMPTQVFWNYGASYDFIDYANPYERMTIDAKANVAKFIGSQTVTCTLAAATFTTASNIILGSSINDGTAYTGAAAWSGKIYSCQIYRDDVLIRDLRPCYDPSGSACMYDKVEKKYYYNQGTGEFIAGGAA